MLEQNEILKNNNKELLKTAKASKKNKNNPKGFKELAKNHLRTLKINGNVSIVFITKENRYITSKISINDVITIIIWGKIDKSNEYQRLDKNDLEIIYSIFEEFEITAEDPDIRVNCSLFEKCIKHVKTFHISEKLEESPEIIEDSSRKECKIKDDSKFFTEVDGVFYFVGSTIKRGSMESYKEIYKNRGESYMLEQVPQRFLDLWENGRELLVEYLNS